MSPEPSQAAGGSRSKYRTRFRKAGELRLVSHHDLMHCFERIFRRAGLPVPATQGFNPRPRMWFAQSLALGIVGGNEVLELELTEALAPEELHDRLTRHCPPGLEIRSVRAIDVRAAGRVRRAFVRLPLAEPIPDLAGRVGAFMGADHHWVERTRPQPRRLDLRPYVSALTAADGHLDMALWITPNGAARAEEVVQALGLGELLEQGAVLERTDLELYDELPAGEATPPPVPAPAAAEGPKEEATDEASPAEQQGGAPRPSALITGPLSFDT